MSDTPRNPRHKERHYARNFRDIITMGLKTFDKMESGKSFVESLGESYGEVRTNRVQEEAEHPIGPGVPIGFRSREARPPEPPSPEVIEANTPRSINTIMKDGIPYCTTHGIPAIVCTICRDRANEGG
jgi:hypothetical protein